MYHWKLKVCIHSHSLSIGKAFLDVSNTLHKLSLRTSYLHTKYPWEWNFRLWSICFDSSKIYCLFSSDFVIRISVIISLSTDFVYLHMTDWLRSLINKNPEAWLYFLITTVGIYSQEGEKCSAARAPSFMLNVKPNRLLIIEPPQSVQLFQPWICHRKQLIRL